jgi:hypothetical protein
MDQVVRVDESGQQRCVDRTAGTPKRTSRLWQVHSRSPLRRRPRRRGPRRGRHAADDPAELDNDATTRLAAAALAGAAIAEHLGSGLDVVIAQYFGRLGYIVMLEDAARQHGATFVEVILATDATMQSTGSAPAAKHWPNAASVIPSATSPTPTSRPSSSTLSSASPGCRRSDPSHESSISTHPRTRSTVGCAQFSARATSPSRAATAFGVERDRERERDGLLVRVGAHVGCRPCADRRALPAGQAAARP